MFLKKLIKNEFLLTIVFILPFIFWLILAIVNMKERSIYTKMELTPLPFIIHAVSAISICFMYLYIFLLSILKNVVFRVVVAISFCLLFMATYEFFYWFFLISNLNFDISKLNHDSFIFPGYLNFNFKVSNLPLKYFKLSIFIIFIVFIFLWFFNRKFIFLSTGKTNIFFSLIIFCVFLIIMIILREQGFFIKTLFWFKGFLYINPHNLLWVLSKFLAMLMFLPLIKIKFYK